jgi:hypothetical protein
MTWRGCKVSRASEALCGMLLRFYTENNCHPYDDPKLLCEIHQNPNVGYFCVFVCILLCICFACKCLYSFSMSLLAIRCADIKSVLYKR